MIIIIQVVRYYLALHTISIDQISLKLISTAELHLLSMIPTGVTIGLEIPNYTVNEGDGNIEVCAVLLEGSLQRTLMVNLSTLQNANAQGQYNERM